MSHLKGFEEKKSKQITVNYYLLGLGETDLMHHAD
jgi:hypothetical protein